MPGGGYGYKVSCLNDTLIKTSSELTLFNILFTNFKLIFLLNIPITVIRISFKSNIKLLFKTYKIANLIDCRLDLHLGALLIFHLNLRILLKRNL